MTDDTARGAAHKPASLAWDPNATGEWSETDWRRNVVAKFNDTDRAMRINTELTQATANGVADVNRKLDALGTSVGPVVELSNQVRMGFRVIGWIGTAAEWIIKKWMTVAVMVIIGKLIFSGATWQEAMRVWSELKP